MQNKEAYLKTTNGSKSLLQLLLRDDLELDESSSITPEKLKHLLAALDDIYRLSNLDTQLSSIGQLFNLNDIHYIILIHHLLGQAMELENLKKNLHLDRILYQYSTEATH